MCWVIRVKEIYDSFLAVKKRIGCLRIGFPEFLHVVTLPENIVAFLLVDLTGQKYHAGPLFLVVNYSFLVCD